MAHSDTPSSELPPPARQPRRGFPTARNVTALVLREMSTRYGRTPGGYMWSVLEPLFAILVLSVGFSLLLRSPSLGTSFLLFYATGYLILNLYMTLANPIMRSIQFSSSLLRFPAVSWIDAVMARFLLNSMTGIITMVLLFTVILSLVETRTVLSLTPIVEATLLAMLLGLGVGVLTLTPAGLYPLFNVVWSVLTRPLMIMSGIIYTYEDLPTFAQNILWYNPLIHLTGLMRTGFYPTYSPTYISFPYVIFFSIIALAFGLVLSSRYHREVQAAL
ncbi:ABC transporter permease [Roseovarius salis]|uniref:ABC transporter permease n=1 Tax=Roseovarius salis TaxID=3376063 RepID=UPI0037C79580